MGIRRTLLGLAVVGLAGCSWLETPCARVADSICTIPSESSSCQFLRNVKSENELAQNTCKDLEPAAKAYAADPTSLVEKAKWLAASVALRAIGFVGDKTASKPTSEQQMQNAANKLQNAANQTGGAAPGLGDAISNMAKNAGNIVRDTAQAIHDEKSATNPK